MTTDKVDVQAMTQSLILVAASDADNPAWRTLTVAQAEAIQREIEQASLRRILGLERN